MATLLNHQHFGIMSLILIIIVDYEATDQRNISILNHILKKNVMPGKVFLSGSVPSFCEGLYCLDTSKISKVKDEPH